MKKLKQDGLAHLGLILVLVVVLVGVSVLAYRRISKTRPLEMASTSDKKADAKETPAASSNKKQQDYNWSKMAQGPYHDSVYYAISSSLTNWPTAKGTLMQEHASVPDVINKDGTLYAYYVDVTQDGKSEQIGVRTSKNGTTWSDKTFATIEGVDEVIPVDPAPFVMPDGQIRLYYLDFATAQTDQEGEHSIYSAISTDGIHFSQEDGVRFSYKAIFDPEVIKVGDAWRMYVGTSDVKVLSATSKDGISFMYEGIAYSGGAIPNVVLEGSTYYLFTGGIDISTSKDGKTFTKSGKRFSPGGPAADPGVAKMSDGRYVMVYKVNTSTQQPTTPPVN